MHEKLLTMLGIVGNEAAIYKAAVKARMATPAVLAKMTGIKRTTAYHIAQVLAEKGLLVEDATKRPRVFIPATPHDLDLVIEREQQAFAARKQTLKGLAAELSRATADPIYPVPHIRFVEEGNVRAFLRQQVLVWHKSVLERDKIWWGFQDHTFLEQYGDLTDWYWKKAKDTIEVKLLSNASPAERSIAKKYPRRTIKFWKDATHFLTTKWVVGDYVVVVNTRRHPFYVIEIHDATFAHDEREVFRNLWVTL